MYRDNFTMYTAFQKASVLSAGAPHEVYLPLIYRNYGWKGPTGNAYGWNSWFQVQVPNGGTANLTVRYYDEAGNALPTTQNLQVQGSKDVYLNVSGSPLPSNFVGSAVIQSDVPIVVLGHVLSDAYAGDPDLTYEAALR
jgi:hypothetical protein